MTTAPTRRRRQPHPTTTAGLAPTHPDPANCGVGTIAPRSPTPVPRAAPTALRVHLLGGPRLHRARTRCETDHHRSKKQRFGLPCAGQDCKRQRLRHHFTSCAELGTCRIRAVRSRSLQRRQQVGSTSRGRTFGNAVRAFRSRAPWILRDRASRRIGGWRLPTTLELQGMSTARRFDVRAAQLQPGRRSVVFAERWRRYWS